MLKKLGGYRRNAWVDIAGICSTESFIFLTNILFPYRVYCYIVVV